MTATTTTARTKAAAPLAPGQLTHRQILTILSGLMLGMFLAALDQTIVATAIRTIGDDLHGLSVQAWVTTAYLITSTISTPLYGKLSDIYGRKPFFLGAITIFVAGSALCATATSMYMLAFFRALQGIGAGGLFSLALAIIGDIVAPRERARYQGYFLAVFGTSSVLGPVIGGFFAGASSILGITGWRWVFLVNVPIGILALVVVFKVLHLPHTRREHRLDWQGALTISIGLVPLLVVAEQGRGWGWGSPRALACYVVGVIGIGLFVWAESRGGEDALIPLRFFRNRTFALTSLVGLIVGMGMFGGIASLPLYLQIVRGASPTQAGLQLIPLTGGIMLTSIVSGQLISRTGRYKIYPLIGAALLVIGMLLLHGVGVDTPYWQTGIYMAVFGAGLGNIMQPTVLAVQNAMPPRDIGVATSSATFFRQMGGSLGVAVFLSILFSSVGGNIKSAFQASARTPQFQAALASPAVQQNPANQPVLDALRSGGSVSSSAVNDTSFISHLDKVLARPFQVGFSQSMDLVFLVAAGVLVVGFVSLLFLPEIPLRTQSGMAAAHEPGAPTGERPDADVLDAGVESRPGQHGADVVPVSADEPGAAALPDRVDGAAGGSREPTLQPFGVTLAESNGSGGVQQPVSRAALTGAVYRPDGAPVLAATLTLTDLAGRQVAQAATAADGSYQLSPGTGGTYLLICLAEGYQPAATMVALGTGDVRRNLALVPAAQLTGRVASADNGPAVSGATITLADADGAVVAAATTGPDGRYVVPDLYAGTYTLTASAASYRPRTIQVAVPEGGHVGGDVTLVASGALAVTVRAASDGRPLLEATVDVIDDTGTVVATGLTDRSGQFHAADLVPGNYTLTASGYAPVATTVQVASGQTDVAEVALGAPVARAVSTTGRGAAHAGGGHATGAAGGARLSAD